MEIELLLAPDCPNAAAARAVLSRCLRAVGLDVVIKERVGAYASPTVLIDGVDVMTGVAGPVMVQACRLDVPTDERVLAALRRC